MVSPALYLTEQLIACRSVTPQDGGCQQIIRARLAPLGFEFEQIDSGPADSVSYTHLTLPTNREV